MQLRQRQVLLRQARRFRAQSLSAASSSPPSTASNSPSSRRAPTSGTPEPARQNCNVRHTAHRQFQAKSHRPGTLPSPSAVHQLPGSAPDRPLPQCGASRQTVELPVAGSAHVTACNALSQRRQGGSTAVFCAGGRGIRRELRQAPQALHILRRSLAGRSATSA